MFIELGYERPMEILWRNATVLCGAGAHIHDAKAGQYWQNTQKHNAKGSKATSRNLKDPLLASPFCIECNHRKYNILKKKKKTYLPEYS
jgi:hypothetical protein